MITLMQKLRFVDKLKPRAEERPRSSMVSLDSFLHITLVNTLLSFINDFGIKFTISVSCHIWTCVHMWTCYGIGFRSQTWLNSAFLDSLELKPFGSDTNILMKHTTGIIRILRFSFPLPFEINKSGWSSAFGWPLFQTNAICTHSPGTFS